MKRLSRKSAVWLSLAALLPLAALIVMQYRFLRKIEQTTVAYKRDALKSFLEEVSSEVEAYYRGLSASAFDIDPAVVAASDARSLDWHFRQQDAMGVRLFFVRTLPAGGGGSIRYFHPEKGEVCPVDPFVEKSVLMSTAPWTLLAEEFGLEPRPQLGVDEHDPINRIILEPVTDEEYRIVGVVGMVLDQQSARRNVLDPMICRARSGAYPDDESLEIRFVTGDTARSMRRDEHDRVLSQGLGFVFKDWSLIARHTGSTPEEMAASGFRINMIWTIVVALLLVSSLLLALRTTLRESRLSQMKSDFVSNVSHELRTPLSSIRVFGEYMSLGRVQDPEKVREYGSYIESEGRRLTQLINNILDFSKIESSEKEYRFERTAVEEIVQATVTSFEKPFDPEKISVTTHIVPNPLPSVMVDRDALVQVLFNLLDNAVKYSRCPAHIRVTVSSHGDEIAISISDNGIGIDASDRKRIFDKFFRVSTGLVHDVKGSGLGLSIVDHIVRAHGGRVEVSGEPGVGSTFTIFLPVAPLRESGDSGELDEPDLKLMDDGVGEPA